MTETQKAIGRSLQKKPVSLLQGGVVNHDNDFRAFAIMTDDALQEICALINTEASDIHECLIDMI
ncbi:MAG: hypothetical protein M1470_03380 [Bacteroidetes bacterium]|nr:hypothetical protein [Bacteroidota bacterium]MCL5737790.1 hypothetical protein [Bacteroidota bacterium]